MRPWQHVKERTPRRGLGAVKGQGPRHDWPAPASQPVSENRNPIAFVQAEGANTEKPPASPANPSAATQKRRIQVGIKGGWAPGYEKETGSKLKEKTRMTEEVNKYKQFQGMSCTNIGWSPTFKDEKLYSFEYPEELQVDAEIFARTVTSIRRVPERNKDIWGAPFGDWTEVVVKAVDAGKNRTAEEYAGQIARENEWTRAPRESFWIGQKRDFSINEEKRCDLKTTIRLKEGETLPDTSKESTRTVYGKKMRVSGLRIYKVERRSAREGYDNGNGEWVGWARPGDPGRASRIPNWISICYEEYCKQCGFYKCRRCSQNQVQPVCEDCHAPHLRHECRYSVDNPVASKAREQEFKRLREEDNLNRGENLMEDMIAELKI